MSQSGLIEERVVRLRREIPAGVTLLAAAKTRTVEEITAAHQAGICHFGHNYVQEAQAMCTEVDFQAEWHLIGHLQRNKVKQALALFDVIETLDSIRLARELEKRCAETGKTVDVLIEVNSGAEEEKSGVLPAEFDPLVEEAARLTHLRLVGLMTMGPLSGEAEQSRPYFVKTRRLFEALREANLPRVDMKILSMGMSGSYRVAIDEGATLVRLGTALFGPRP